MTEQKGVRFLQVIVESKPCRGSGQRGGRGGMVGKVRVRSAPTARAVEGHWELRQEQRALETAHRQGNLIHVAAKDRTE